MEMATLLTGSIKNAITMVTGMARMVYMMVLIKISTATKI